MKRILMTIVLLLGATGAAQAIQCSALPDITAPGSWSWQWIDSRICWYLGDASVAKESLHWQAPEQAAALPYPGEPAQKSTIAGRPAQKTKAAGKPAQKSTVAGRPAQKTKAASEPAQKINLAGSPAQTMQCHVRPGPGRWTWRTVDGRQCWFVGARDTPKALLQWPQEQRETREEAEHPEQAEIDSLDQAPQQPEPVSPHPWQLVNQESGGDLEFLAVGEPVAAPLSINLYVGTEFLTRIPVAYWPNS